MFCTKKAKGALVSEDALHIKMAVSRILSAPNTFGVVDDHLSKRHTRGLNRTGCPPSVLSCTAWGFSCHANCSARGELLPRLFTLACAKKRTVVLSKNRRCLFCDTFRQPRLGSGLPAYSTRHAAVWCSDFPPVNRRGGSPAIICHRRKMYHNKESRKAGIRLPHCVKQGNRMKNFLCSSFPD